MESLIARLSNIKPIICRPALPVHRHTRAVTITPPAPVPEPAKPCPIIQESNIKAIPLANPTLRGSSKALPFFF